MEHWFLVALSQRVVKTFVNLLQKIIRKWIFKRIVIISVIIIFKHAQIFSEIHCFIWGVKGSYKVSFFTNNFDTLAISANGWYEGIYDLLFDLNLWFDPTLGKVDLTLAFVLIIIDVPGKAKLKILSESCLKTLLLSGAKAFYSNYHLLTYQVISKSAWIHAFLQKSVFQPSFNWFYILWWQMQIKFNK